MKYHDTASRDASQVLATWLKDNLSDEVTELRIQSGYFSIHAVGLLLPTLERAVRDNLLTKILIGSNDSSTIKSHVEELVRFMGIPRTNAHLGVVYFARGFFHPKTYHLRRLDGSQLAFVGSANLTREGLALHVEAAISLDTRDGDDEKTLSSIAEAIDKWFTETQEGFTRIDNTAIIDTLVEEGILTIAPPVKPPRISNADNISQGNRKTRLIPLTALPKVILSTALDDASNDPDEIDDQFATANSLIPSATLTNTNQIATSVAGPSGSITIGSAVIVNTQIVTSSLTFGMTLQNTDVGVGQTSATQTTQRRSPEIFIPMGAVDLQPAFWGWQAKFTPDHVWAASKGTWLAAQTGKPFNPLRPRMKMDWRNVSINLIGHPGLITASIWHDPIKVDIRIRAEQIRSAGSVGDIMLVRVGATGSGYDFEIEIIKTTNPLYASFLARLVTPIRNSQKRIGYF